MPDSVHPEPSVSSASPSPGHVAGSPVLTTGARLREPGRHGVQSAELLAAEVAFDRACATGADAALLHRAVALLDRAQAEAQAGRPTAARDALAALDGELAATLSPEERSARAEAALAETAALAGWRGPLASRLARPERDGAIGVAALQAVLANLHAARREREAAQAANARQIPAAAGLLVFCTLFFTLWALAGGFDWLTNEDYEVTPGMWLVTGVLFGYFGGLASVVLRLLGTRSRQDAPPAALRWPVLATFARPVVGAVIAVPVVLFMHAGLFALGDFDPVTVLALCFAGGFMERAFAREVERLATR